MRDRLIAGAMVPATLVDKAQIFRRWYRERVLDLFKPQSCDVLLFQPQSARKKVRCGYPLKRSVRQNLSCGYRVSFDHHFKPVEGAAGAFEIVL